MSNPKVGMVSSKGITGIMGYNCPININEMNVTSEQNPKRRKTEVANLGFCLPPFIEAKSFNGRNNEMENLDNLFFKENKKMVAICGFAGLGKTELAAQFATWCVHKGKVDHVLWMDATEEESLQKSLEENNLQRFFHKDETVFIVFDDAPNRQACNVAKLDNFFFLITSRVKYMENLEILPLGELKSEHALKLLLDEVNYNEDDVYLYKRLAKTCDNVPLALQIISSYVKYDKREPDFDLENYVKKLENSPENMLDISLSDYKLTGSSITYKHKISIYETVKITLKKIEKINKFALKVLHFCTYLNTEYIFYTTLREILSLSGINENKYVLNDIVSLLVDFALIKRNTTDAAEKKITMHRFIQKVIHHHLTKCSRDIQQNIFETCLELTLMKKYYFHIPSIVSRADVSEHYTNMFLLFFNEFKEHLTNAIYTKLKKYKASCTGLQLFLEILIEGRCKDSLDNILENLRPETEKNINDFNLLLAAVESGDNDILQLLLKYKPNVDQADNDGHTALFLATFEWNEDMINILVDSKASIQNVKDDTRNTILHRFIKGAYYIERPIDIEQIKRIIEKLKGNNNMNEIKNDFDETLLHVAAGSLRPELVDLLISHYDMQPNAQTTSGWTPLFVTTYEATKCEAKEEDRVVKTIEMLLSKNADLNIPNYSKITPLQLAKMNKLNYLINLFEKSIETGKGNNNK